MTSALATSYCTNLMKDTTKLLINKVEYNRETNRNNVMSEVSSVMAWGSVQYCGMGQYFVMPGWMVANDNGGLGQKVVVAARSGDH